jgi:hypothetical protein
MTPQDFYSQYLPYAEKVSNQTGLDPRLVLAQAALETGYGKSAPNMNFFGIKSHGRKGGQTLQTSEFENGQIVGQPASFRGYESPDQSFQDYASFLKSNPRYEDVLSAEGLEDQISAMAKSGYATDPNYGAKLANIAGKFDPSSPPIVASDTLRVLGTQPKGLLASNTMNTTESEMVPEQKPTGLLGGLFSDPDKRARLAMALEGMTLNPNRALLASLQGGIEQRGLDKKEAAAEAKSLAQRNKTLEFLAGQEGGEQFVRLADAAGVPTAIKAYMESKKAPKAGQDLQKYELAKSQGFEGTYLDFEKALQGFEPGPGLKALDETFAKTLDGTSAQQLAAARQDTASVAKVLEQLEAGENLTGPLIGSIPEELRALIYPESVQAQQLVEQVVQKNLRAILGGQFAQKEGELLVKRAYNPKLNPQQNAARLRSLLLTLDAAAKGKQEQTDYFFNNNYSLRGYTGFAGVPTYEDFNNALDNAPNGITEKRNQGGSTRIIFDESGNEVKQ